jgi:hypothetical protein
LFERHAEGGDVVSYFLFVGGLLGGWLVKGTDNQVLEAIFLVVYLILAAIDVVNLARKSHWVLPILAVGIYTIVMAAFFLAPVSA